MPREHGTWLTIGGKLIHTADIKYAFVTDKNALVVRTEHIEVVEQHDSQAEAVRAREQLQARLNGQLREPAVHPGSPGTVTKEQSGL